MTPTRALVRGFLAAALAVGAAGCSCGSQNPTIFVQVNIDSALPAVDQLSFQVDKAGSTSLGPTFRPEQASSSPLALDQSVRLALPEGYLGTVTIVVRGLASGTVVGSGKADGLARAASETTVVVNLGPEQICDASSCPSGCCANGICVVDSSNLCGTAAGTCSACDSVSSDRCDNGVCRCGTGPQCLSGQVCTNGSCTCDTTTCPNGCCAGTACLPGDTDGQCGAGGNACSSCGGSGCDAGICPSCAAACDAGCCSGASCLTNSITACGSGGNLCQACDKLLADRCTGGECKCGGGQSCGAGQQCVGGACRCNATSCAKGCCQGDQCEVAALGTCGVDGGACTNCSTTVADGCSLSGKCACGTGAACPPGGVCGGGLCTCDGGACVPPCDATTCPTGCCSAGVCIPSALATCGTAGGACVDCSVRGNTCSNGVCTCVGNPICAAGQRCSSTGGGTCVCDATSGCSGCCSGGTCQSADTTHCGANGAMCKGCSNKADRCLNGTCSCGTSGNQCNGNKTCQGGSCQ